MKFRIANFKISQHDGFASKFLSKERSNRAPQEGDVHHFRRIGRMRGAPGAGIEVKGVEHRYELYSLHTGSLHHDDEVMRVSDTHNK